MLLVKGLTEESGGEEEHEEVEVGLDEGLLFFVADHSHQEDIREEVGGAGEADRELGSEERSLENEDEAPHGKGVPHEEEGAD